MRTRRIGPRFLCLLPVLVLAIAELSYASPQWVQVRSAHFTVITDAGESRGREVALHFEQMRSVFGAFMSKPNLELPSPMQVVAFRSTKEMRRFVPLWRGKPIDMMGYYHQSSDCSVILLDLSVKNYWQTAFHEYAHQLLNANTSAETQPWFDEGFAEYFSTIRVQGNDAEVGAAHEKDFKVVRHKRLMTTADLLQVRQDSDTYNQDGTARNVFYGQSWLMVHYLFDTHSLPKAFDYFARIAEGTTSIEEAFRQSFGMSTEQFDGVLREYARQKRLNMFPVGLTAQNRPATYTVRWLSGTEAAAQLADVHLHSAEYGDVAVREFDRILQQDASNAVALRGLGFAYLEDRDFARASELLHKAQSSYPNDARVQYYAALLTRDEAQEQGPPTSEKIAVMQKGLRKAIGLEPGYAAAYRLLAITYEWQGNQEKSAEAMKRAVELNPRNRVYRAEWARISGGPETATILKQLEPPRSAVSTQASGK